MDDTQELKSQIEDLRQQLQEMRDVLASHGHTGQDGSTTLTTNINLDRDQYFKSGPMFLEGITPVSETLYQGGIGVGDDDQVADGSTNTQVSINHSKNRNAQGLFDSFVFGLRGPIYSASDGDINSGGSTLQQDTYTWETDELDGAYVVVYTTSTEYEMFEIASNTSDTLTITGGTWSASVDPAIYLIFMPVYLGSGTSPWRRVYTMEGTDGGVRFGGGDTDGGQNGLLYMNSSGDLYWRNKAGTPTKLN